MDQVPHNTSLAIAPQAKLDLFHGPYDQDLQILKMWIAERPAATARAYAADSVRLFEFCKKDLLHITLADLQDFAAHLRSIGLSDASCNRTMAAIKSLFTFASDRGIRHIPFNVGAAIHLKEPKNKLNERILTEQQVQKMIDAARPGRNQFLVELTYRVGVRVEELVGLHWRDAQPAGDGGGLLTIYGKGSKTRVIRLEPADWAWLTTARSTSDADDAPIIKSRNGGCLSKCQAWRIVHDAAIAAGLKAGVSPHWLRHAHATHAIDHGADPRTVQHSLGHSSFSTTERYIHSRPRKSSGSFLPPRANPNLNAPPPDAR